MRPRPFTRNNTQAQPIAPATLLLGLLLLTHAAPALAQFSGTVSLVSDYRFRGVSLSDEKAVPQASLAYDHPSGWYAGAFLSPITIDQDNGLQTIVYGGYAGRLNTNLSWEAGVSDNIYRGVGDYNYAEIFAGVSWPNLNAKLYLAPRYFGQDQRTAYLEANAFHALNDTFNLVGHLGVLHLLSGTSANSFSAGQHNRFDARLGLAASYREWNFQLSWVAVESRGGAGADALPYASGAALDQRRYAFPPPYPGGNDGNTTTSTGTRQHDRAWIISLARSF